MLGLSTPFICPGGGSGWLVGCFGSNGPLRQYFSLYPAVSQKEGEIGERIDESKNVQKKNPPAPAASAVGPCPTVIQIVGRPGTGSLPSTIAPPDHPGLSGGATVLGKLPVPGLVGWLFWV